jgi:hypothetical protein
MPKTIRSVVLLATVTFLATSCGIGDDAGTVGPTTAATRAAATSGRTLTSRTRGGSDSLSLFACAADSIADSASAVIGPLGGQIQFGPHTLVVPPGALLRSTTITATAPGDGYVDAVFQPEGLHFLVPAQLTLTYAQCSPAPDHQPSITYLQSLLGDILDILPSLDNPSKGQVVAPITHFSVYAVAD